MSVFALCDHEGEVQLGDKTRFDASKSFYAKGGTALTTLTIQPGIGASAISVFDSDSSNWYLDWCFSESKIDVGAANAELRFLPEGEADYLSVSIAAGSYTLAQYLTALQTLMNDASEVTFTLSSEDEEVTVAADGTVKFLDSPVARQLFLPLNEVASSHTGSRIEWYIRTVIIAAGNGTSTSSKTVYPKVFTEEGDRLFCSDTDLLAHEPDILKWVSPGRNSHKNVYRRAQKLMLQWLEDQGYCDVFGNPYDKFDIVELEGVRDWATYKSLQLIFEGIKNQVDDVFGEKAREYEKLAAIARSKALLRLDTNSDGIVDATEGLHSAGGELFRR